MTMGSGRQRTAMHRQMGQGGGWYGWAMGLVFLAGPAIPAAAGHLEVVIETDGTNFLPVSKRVVDEEPQSHVYRQRFQEGFYYVQALDANGKVVHVESLPDPTLVIYDIFEETPDSQVAGEQLPDQPTQPRGGVITLPSADFIVRIPNGEGVTRLQVYRIHEAGQASDGAQASQIAPDQSLAGADIPAGVMLEAVGVLDLTTLPEATESP